MALSPHQRVPLGSRRRDSKRTAPVAAAHASEIGGRLIQREPVDQPPPGRRTLGPDDALAPGAVDRSVLLVVVE